MDISVSLGLVAVIALVVANGFFVATEFSIVAVRRSRLEQLAAEGYPKARAARDVVDHLDSYIAATQLGITMASLALGWIGKPALATLVDPVLVSLFGYADPIAAHAVSAAFAFAVITMLHIVIGELMPKGLALQRPERTALWVAGPIKVFYVLFRWPINFLNAIGNGMLKLIGLEPASGHEMVHSVEELRLLVTGMQRAGVVEASEARIASRAFQFADLTAGVLMTPRTEMDAIPITATRADLLAYARTGAHSRLPIYEGSLDNIIGVLRVRDLFRTIDDPAPFDIRTLVHPILAVPESKPADELLDEMRTTGRIFAVVVDEYGGTAGVVTLWSLLGGLVGGIAPDESDSLAPPAVSADVAADGSRQLDGLTRLDELEEILDVRLDDEDRDLADTLGGLIMARLGRIPDVGDDATIVGRTFRVEEKDGMRVSRVRLSGPVVSGVAARDGAG
ncbi:MAG: HlyC/CorC family transporter [Chloroflexota bacterium]|nr:MAG: HlyC/CorC family transporter [Chloroflexota bacterium]